MTRKDFTIIARVLAKYSAEGGVTVERDEIAYKLADDLALAYPRFDRRKFLVACGVWKKAVAV
jgi:hypothetical protein